jgi:7,8-dihydropterin-6-yl-methyl-4-(beta-D-ribofuranosyl)aminobenzene 5'-phosphate synthase
MINIMGYAMEQLGTDRIHAIIGGTHLIASNDDQLDKTLKWFDKHKVEHVGVSHCTGPIKASLLHQKLGDRFFFASVGTEFKA